MKETDDILKQSFPSATQWFRIHWWPLVQQLFGWVRVRQLSRIGLVGFNPWLSRKFTGFCGKNESRSSEYRSSTTVMALSHSNGCILERHSHWEPSITHTRVTWGRLEYGIVRSPSSVSGVLLDIQKENSDFPLKNECVCSNQVFKSRLVYGDVNRIQEEWSKRQDDRHFQVTHNISINYC